MNTPLPLLKRLRIALSEPRSYAMLYNQSIARTLFAFFLFSTLCGLLYGIGSYLFIQKITPTTEQLSLFSQDIHALYPQDLVMHIDNGVLSINQQSPYTVELPPRWKQFFQAENAPQSLVTIDTNAAVEDYYRYNSLALMTNDTLVYPRKDLEISFLRYQDILQNNELHLSSVTVNHDIFQAFMTEFADPFIVKVPKYLNNVGLGVALLISLFFGLFTLLFVLPFLLFVTALLWMVNRFILKRTLTYGQLYFLGFSGVMPILLLHSLCVLMGFWIISPLLFVALYVGWMIFVVLNMEKIAE